MVTADDDPRPPTATSALTAVLGFLPPTVLIAGLLVQLGWVREQTRLDHLGLRVRANLTVFEYMLNARPFALLAVAVFGLLALGEAGRQRLIGCLARGPRGRRQVGVAVLALVVAGGVLVGGSGLEAVVGAEAFAGRPSPFASPLHLVRVTTGLLSLWTAWSLLCRLRPPHTPVARVAPGVLLLSLATLSLVGAAERHAAGLGREEAIGFHTAAPVTLYTSSRLAVDPAVHTGICVRDTGVREAAHRYRYWGFRLAHRSGEELYLWTTRPLPTGGRQGSVTVVRLDASTRIEFRYERVADGSCPAGTDPLTAPG